jgi:hypothetical protein
MHAVFVTLVESAADASAARLLIAGLRRFGGAMGAAPVWVFDSAPDADASSLAAPGVAIVPLDVPPSLAAYPYGAKVLACARAEAGAQGGARSLIWLDPECLVVRPPVAFDLGDVVDVAVRPVHLRGVGLPPGEPLDAFWAGVCAAAGVADVESTVESFVDGARLRAFFNSHGFSVRPGLGLCRRWLRLFEGLVGDPAFQAVFSALVASSILPGRLRLLPPDCNYPYNLHARVPKHRRAAALDDLVCFAYEGRSLRPADVDDVEVGEPLRSWLDATLAAVDGSAPGPGDGRRAAV